MMILEPLYDRVVLKNIKSEETTKGGIILAPTSQEKPVVAEVIAAGPGDKDITMVVKPGDKVITSKYAGTEVKVDGEEYIIVRQSDILVKVK